MISIKHKFKTWGFLFIALFIILPACNKEVEQFPESTPVAPPGPSLGETIAAIPNNSLFYNLIVRSGLLPTINNKATTFTVFVPDNTAMKLFINAASGGLVPLNAPDAIFSGFISSSLPVSSAAGIVGYNIIPQLLTSAGIPSAFPNFQYATILNPAPSLSAFLRLTIFPASRNGSWVNNIPITGPDVPAANGVIHPSAFLVTPPQRYLWDRINTDAGLTYLKAAITRADSGVAATSPVSLIGALNNIGANLTVFAPTDAAFQLTLTGAIFQGLTGLPLTPANAAAHPVEYAQAVALASSTDVFTNPLLFSVLTAQTVKGIAVYHILGNRAFTNNFPTTATFYPTLLNSAVPIHPGVSLQAVFGAASAPFATTATVKGVGNATASNILIIPAPPIPAALIPEPFGNSDQHYLNGVLHKIDQVLLPL
ncbi:MAG: fasciclin domain-containing protein [Ginsengibacter sp.]